MSTDTKAIILAGFNAGTVQAAEDFEREKQRVIDACKAVTNTDTSEGMEKARQAVVDGKAFIAGIEKRREEVKKPVLDLGREIDAFAKTLNEGLAEPLARVNSMIVAQLKAEREAQEAAQRAEADRQRKAAEEQRKAEIEAARLKEEATKAEAGGDKAKAAELEEKAFEESLRAEEAAMAPAPVFVPAVQPKGVSAKPTFDYEINGKTEWEIAASLLALAQVHPHFVKIEIRRSVVLDAINRAGERNLPGLTVKETLNVRIR